METLSQRFQIYPLWRAFSNLSVFGVWKRRLRVDVLLARTLRHQFSHVFTWNPTLHPHVMPKWRCRTVRNVERIERLAKVLVENKLSLFSNVLPHVAVVTSQTPYKHLTCPHHVIQPNTAAYSPQWGPIASTSSGKDRTWNKMSYNLILEGLLNIILIIL